MVFLLVTCKDLHNKNKRERSVFFFLFFCTPPQRLIFLISSIVFPCLVLRCLLLSYSYICALGTFSSVSPIFILSDDAGTIVNGVFFFFFFLPTDERTSNKLCVLCANYIKLYPIGKRRRRWRK